MEILKSASKVVLLMMSSAVMITFCGVVFANLKSENIVMATITIAASAVSSVMTYYFTKKNLQK